MRWLLLFAFTQSCHDPEPTDSIFGVEVTHDGAVQFEPKIGSVLVAAIVERSQLKSAIKQRWTALRADQLSNSKILQRVTDVATLLKENGAVQRNNNKWNQDIGVDYDATVSI